MISTSHPNPPQSSQTSSSNPPEQEERSPAHSTDQSPLSTNSKTEVILCPHCLRTATNGIKCQGICVADSNY